jgi:hypothetical protein
MPPTHPVIASGQGAGGWEFLIPNSQFLISYLLVYGAVSL